MIKRATRACYGLFPKRLLMEFIWLMAARCHIHHIYGVSDSGHVFRALRYRLSKGRHFHASYNEFWHSIDGVADGAWRWRLPLQLERKTLRASPVRNAPNIVAASSCWMIWPLRWRYSWISSPAASPTPFSTTAFASSTAL